MDKIYFLKELDNIIKNGIEHNQCYFKYIYKNLFFSTERETGHTSCLIVGNVNGYRHIEYLKMEDIRDHLRVATGYFISHSHDFETEFNDYSVYGYNVIFYYMDLPNLIYGFDNSFNCGATNKSYLNLIQDFRYDFRNMYSQGIHSKAHLNLIHFFSLKEMFSVEAKFNKSHVLEKFENVSAHKLNTMKAVMAYCNQKIGVSGNSHHYRSRFKNISEKYFKIFSKYQELNKKLIAPKEINVSLGVKEKHEKIIKKEIFETITEEITNKIEKKSSPRFDILRKYMKPEAKLSDVLSFYSESATIEYLFTEFFDLAGRSLGKETNIKTHPDLVRKKLTKYFLSNFSVDYPLSEVAKKQT
jgi:hypothetical protein